MILRIFKFTDEDLAELDNANSNAARSTTNSIADSQISTSPPARFTASALVLITFCHVK